MSTKALDIERWVLELLIVLKQESEAMVLVKTWLMQLRERVIERDESALEGLLNEIQSKPDLTPQLEQQRQRIRLELATVLGIPFEQVTLTSLECVLTGELKIQVSHMKAQLQEQTQALQVQRQSLATFLADCARFNRLLLNSFLNNTHQNVTTYSPRGHAQHRRSSDLVNMQF